MPQTILHADLDAFFASVEQLDRPELRGKPVVVGGPPERRGVVAAASYEARRFGVRSAMPMARALRLCPEALRVPPRFDRYAELSHRVMAIFRSITPLVEPLSLDEAYLGVTAEVEAHGGPERLARSLKERVQRETGLVVSVGVGANKSVAKIASDRGKPDGLVVVPAGKEAEFLHDLPVRDLWGIGPRSEELLHRAGVETIGDLARLPAEAATRLLGSRGAELRDMANGVDPRPVVTSRERKSVGAETTFPRDLPDGPELRAELRQLAEEVATRLRHEGKLGYTVTLKLRYHDFRTVTRQQTLARPVDAGDEVERVAAALLDGLGTAGARFRLVGVTCSRLVERGAWQPDLWGAVADPFADGPGRTAPAQAAEGQRPQD